MGRAFILVAVLLLPQGAVARMYMCVDEVSGATSFTDKACETAGSREEIRINPITPNSASPQRSSDKNRAGRSQLDARKTGTDFNAERRALYKSKVSGRSQ